MGERSLGEFKEHHIYISVPTLAGTYICCLASGCTSVVIYCGNESELETCTSLTANHRDHFKNSSNSGNLVP